MRNWSAEELFIRAYAAGAVAAQGVWDVVKGVERITKPPRRTGFDEDAAAEFLAERPSDTGDCWCPRKDHPHECDTPNPTEPGLDDCELIGVRGLLQERYGSSDVYADGYVPICCRPGGRCWRIERDQSVRADTQDAQMWRAYVDPDQPWPGDEIAKVWRTPDLRGGNHTGAAAQPDVSASSAADTPSQDAPDMASDEGSPADSGIPQPPAGGQPAWPAWYLATVVDVLADHIPDRRNNGGIFCAFQDDGCDWGKGPMDRATWQEWREHVAPLIAKRLDDIVTQQLSDVASETSHEQSTTK